MASTPFTIGGSRSWLGRHLVTIAALLAFMFLALTVVQQGRVIHAQQTLIRTIFSDSLALNHLRAHVTQERQEHAKQAEKPGPAGHTNPELRQR